MQFAGRQKTILEEGIRKVAAEDEWVPLLVQLPEIGTVFAARLVAVIEDFHRFDPVQVARSIFRHAYYVGIANLPDGQSALVFIRYHLDRLGLGEDMPYRPWGSELSAQFEYFGCPLRFHRPSGWGCQLSSTSSSIPGVIGARCTRLALYPRLLTS